MKKVLLIYRINRDDPGNSGVIKKCKAQAKAFRNLGMEADMLWLCKEGILINEKLVYKKQLIPHTLGIYWFYLLQFGPSILKLADIAKYDLIYLRHPFFDPLLVRFLKSAKLQAPNLKTILEINTYPYDAEPERLLHRFSLKMDQYFRSTAFKYIDRIVDYGQGKNIWNIPTINIRNGIDIDQLRLGNSQSQKGKLRLIAIGNWSYWHGLDRLIKGLGAYYLKGAREMEILLTIVGDGGEKGSLIALANELVLEKYIRFLKTTTGEELDRIFDTADIGIGTLGMHRKGVSVDSSLKHREYCSRGIPFILSSPDLDFPEGLQFVHYVPNDDSAIDLESLLEVFLKWKEEDRRVEIRKYAEEHLTWEKQLLPVVQWLES